MPMSSNLNVLIGAGFSFFAGLPLGKEINGFFDRDIREKLRRHSSSEWQWVDGKDKATINNGQSNWDYASYSYILQGLVIEYKRINDGSFLGYEDFFQFGIDILNAKVRLVKIYESAKAKFSEDYPDIPDDSIHWEVFKESQVDILGDIINYLIADVLRWKKEDAELLTYYGVFLDQLKAYSIVNVFSLNHDLLLEHLLRRAEIEFSDGFTRDKAVIVHEEEQQRTFQNLFNAPIRLCKMHGSIDTYKFLHADESRPGLVRPDGNYTYFKADSYSAKHYAMRVNDSGEVVQEFQLDVVPRFITGTDKVSLIESDNMYSTLISRMKSELNSSSDLMVCGYSFGDDQINSIIQESCAKHQPKVVNINPNQPFPYHVSDVQNLSDLSNLTKHIK
jgi:hypothetical protein